MKQAGLSGAELARYAGISKQYVSLIRSGKTQAPSASTARSIERVLGVERGVLFDYGPGTGERSDADTAAVP
jgi:transcriptional regulator with XRE-family HTH domain